MVGTFQHQVPKEVVSAQCTCQEIRACVIDQECPTPIVHTQSSGLAWWALAPSVWL